MRYKPKPFTHVAACSLDICILEMRLDLALEVCANVFEDGVAASVSATAAILQ